MAPRSESDILARAPIKVKFGEVVYDIQPLTILKARAWRTLLNESLGGIVQNFKGPVGSTQDISSGLTLALLDVPEKLVDLVFSYAPDLPKEKILAVALEEEMVIAFSAIMQVAFPFLAQLGKVTEIVKSSLN